MPDGAIKVSIPILPRNTNEMKATDLYTDSVYPVSGGALHAWEGCPDGGGIEGSARFRRLDSGAYSTCETCGFNAASMGSVAAASTSVENGFEYHFRKVAESARDYERAKMSRAGVGRGSRFCGRSARCYRRGDKGSCGQQGGGVSARKIWCACGAGGRLGEVNGAVRFFAGP